MKVLSDSNTRTCEGNIGVNRLNSSVCGRPFSKSWISLRQTPELVVTNALRALDAQYAEAHRAQAKMCSRHALGWGWVEGVDGKPSPPERTWYLPHHAVYQDSQGKTECQVVFDGSAEWNGTSLNSCLEVTTRLGPPPHFVRPGAVCPQQLCTLFSAPVPFSPHQLPYHFV
ncbi:hypothetical protein T11_9389 [Trichinella zimbabwensis]|uniref:Uncharacterized protein n=1 Tax=Trichinella zimbabwensis TaxID=268475 RepID=A0A0V1HLP6_9BILA|nr:hypothetical protein T11_9389 [Trichinella zimbabwensis]